MKRYTHIVLRRIPPLNGFSIKTPDGRFLSDIRPRAIVMELNRLNDRIRRLEKAGDAMETRLHLRKNISDQFVYKGDAESVENWNKAKEDKL